MKTTMFVTAIVCALIGTLVMVPMQAGAQMAPVPSAHAGEEQDDCPADGSCNPKRPACRCEGRTWCGWYGPTKPGKDGEPTTGPAYFCPFEPIELPVTCEALKAGLNAVCKEKAIKAYTAEGYTDPAKWICEAKESLNGVRCHGN